MSKKKLTVSLMLDSGVFSAWARGETLKLSDYISYVREHKDWLYSYVNMDVIPGKYGEKRTQQQVEDSAKGSYDNLQKMKDKGLSPIPVFHQGERLYWLERMLADGERYIGISSAKDIMPDDQRKWLDQMFTIITNKDGAPLIKTHGFGITNLAFVQRYPWFTVDSTTWALSAGFGKIMVPVYRGGKPDFSKAPVSINVTLIEASGASAYVLGNKNRKFETLGPVQQKWVLDYLGHLGVTLTEVRYSVPKRRYSIIRAYQEVAESLCDVHFGHRGAMPSIKVPKIKPISIPHPTVMFASSISSDPRGEALQAASAHTRLLSYYETRTKDPEILHRYIETGALDSPRKNYKFSRKPWREDYLNFRRLRLFDRLNEPSEPAA